MSDYPYDEAILQEVADLLYRALPAMYRVPDEPPAGKGELRRFVEVLAGPLAVLRQSIREMHSDLFIDTAADRMIPYLAEMVGTRLVFPDVESNRRDVRGTVAWRRRKGTPVALEEMGTELTGQSVVLQEGWKRIQLAQDLNLIRPERVVPDLRPAVVAEQATGPLDALHHSVDVRSISAVTGRRHPRHVAHWVHPTITFPLREATAFDRTLAGSDFRYAFDPLGTRMQLRARRVAGDRRPFVDRIPELHFSADPGRWFGQTGGFAIRVCGLEGGIAKPQASGRAASDRVASPHLGRGDVTVAALELPARGWRGSVRVELGLATVNAAGPGQWRPNPATFAARASVDLDAGGMIGSSTTGGPTPGGVRVPLLRIVPMDGAPGCFFPGATLELASASTGATAAAEDSRLAREGFLRGVLHVEIPALEVQGERLLHIAADGSLYEAGSSGSLVDMPEVAGDRRLARSAMLVAGPGAAWPPLPVRSEPKMLNRVPAAPGRGPALMHGGRALRSSGGAMTDLPPAARCALSFAAQVDDPGGPEFRPFQRLEWSGSDPGGATWTALDDAGLPLGPAARAARYTEVAELRKTDPDRMALAVRFECSEPDATLCLAEVAWSADDGRTVLIHLPQLDAAPVPAGDPWPAEAAFSQVSEAVRVGRDGSTWASASTAGRRMSHGPVAPIAEAAGLRRRLVRRRVLCGWDREDWTAAPPQTLPLTDRGRLDVDVAHGLFAFSAQEPPQSWPAPGTSPAVTVDFEEGATMHIGALPAAREPLLNRRLARPTRLVSRSGAFHADAPPDWHAIPLYPTLSEALAAVSAEWQALPPGTAGEIAEVIQFEDSATYADEAPGWPEAPADASVRAATSLSLTIQASERERPTILVDAAAGWSLPPAVPVYGSLTMLGLAFGAEGWAGMTVPPCGRVRVELCTVLDAANTLTFSDLPAGTRVEIERSETAGLELAGTGVLAISDGIVDAFEGVALRAPSGRLWLDRVSVGGDVEVRILDASEVAFDGRIEVEDRFHGCVRYSRVESGSVLPRVHRVVHDTPVRVVSHNRRDAAWWRLREDCDPAITRGAENGSEMGAFSANRLAERMAGFVLRLGEYTPVGLVTGTIRID